MKCVRRGPRRTAYLGSRSQRRQAARRLRDHRLKRTDRPREIVLVEIGEPDVQPDSRNIRRKFFGLPQCRQSLRPLLAPHMNHAEIGVSSRYARVDRQHLPEGALTLIQPTRTQRGFSSGKHLLRIMRRWCFSGGRLRLRRRRALRASRTRKKKRPKNHEEHADA